MKKIVFLIVVMSTLFSNAQQLTVFYKEKRIPAKSERQEIGGMLSVELGENALPENDPDSLYVDVRRTVDSIRKLIAEYKKHNFDLESITEYEYTTILKIDKKTSIYYPEEQVHNDTIAKQVITNSGRNISKKAINYNDSEIIYKDLSLMRKVSALKVYIFDTKQRSFLIEEPLKEINWTLTNEIKKIDKYLCYKAISSKKGIPVEVWYTKEIPVNDGPKGYWGLPGLILEIKEGKKQLNFDKISFFPNSIVIKQPNEGFKVTREEFEDLPSKLFNEDHN